VNNSGMPDNLSKSRGKMEDTRKAGRFVEEMGKRTDAEKEGWKGKGKETVIIPYQALIYS